MASSAFVLPGTINPFPRKASCLLPHFVEYSCRIALPRFIPRGPMRHLPCKLLLAFAALLFTLPAFAAEHGNKHVETSDHADHHTLLIHNTD